MLGAVQWAREHLRKRAWPGRSGSRYLASIGLVWTAVALIFSAQGYLVSAYRGSAQPWWPSLGYSLAIFSIWALLTPVIVQAVRKVEATGGARFRRGLVYAAGLPIVCALHVVLFALLYWPIYNDGGRIPTRWAMGELMFLKNLDTNTLFYVLVVGVTAFLLAKQRQPASPGAIPARPAQPDAMEPVPLQVRVRGRLRLVPLSQIDWIQAAGDYAEVHAGNESLLLDESLTSLSQRLPADFARIHRQSLIRLDRVKEVRSLGRGDAAVVLSNGTELRLSRRYRTDLLAYLARSRPVDPADR